MKLKHLSFMLLLLLLTGCYKEDLDKCNIRLTIRADWSQRGAEEDEPAGFTARAQSTSASVEGSHMVYPHKLDPGLCRVDVYNEPDFVSFSGDIATVAAATRSGGLHCDPGCLFTYTESLSDVKKGGKYEINAVKKQQMRRLCLIVESAAGINGKITGAAAVLDGVASSINIVTEDLSNPSYLSIPFAAIDGDKMEATVKMLGVMGTNNFSLELELANGQKQTIEMDFTSRLSDFNDAKNSKQTLTITLTGVNQITGEITDWTVRGGYTGIAD